MDPKNLFFLLILGGWAMATAGCKPAERASEPVPEQRAEPAEPAPLETVTMDDEAIVPIQEQGDRRAGAAGVPCAWAGVWEEPGKPRPMPVGGAVKEPKKVLDVAPVLPYREDPPKGTPILEAVIAPDGSVWEVKVLESFHPPWPEADAAIVEAVRRWRYEPTIFEGKPIPVCAKIALRIEWTEFSRGKRDPRPHPEPPTRPPSRAR